MNLFELVGTIAIVGASQAHKDIDTTKEKANGLGTALKNGITTIGKWGVALTGAATAAGSAFVSMAADYETSFAKVSTLLTGTEDEINAYKDAIVKASDETGVSVGELSESVYNAISAGVDQADAINFTTEALKLAKGGFTDTTTAVDILTTAINAYGMESSDATTIANKLITTQNLGKTTVAELASSMGKIIPTANSLNVDIDQLCAAYATMTSNGIATAETTTYLNGMLNELGKQGSTAADAFAAGTADIKEGGLTMQEAMEMGYSLTDVLAVLEKEAQKSGTNIANMFGSAEAGKAATVLSTNTSKQIANVEAMSDSAGATETAFSKMESTLSSKITKLQTKLKNMGITIGNKLMPFVEKLFDMVEAFLPTIQVMIDKIAPVLISMFEKILPLIMNLAQQILPLLVNLISTILPPLLQIVEAILPPIIELLEILLPPLIEIVETILPPIIEIISAILPVLAQIVAEILPLLLELIQPILDLLHPLLEVLMPILDTVIQFISPLLQIITQILKPIITVLTTVFEKLSNFIKPIIQWMAKYIGGTLKDVLNVIMNVIGAVGEAFKTVWNSIKNVWSGAADFFSGIWNGIKNAFGSVADWFKNIFSKAWEAVKNVFSTGGKIFDGIKDGIVTAFKTVVNAIIKGINKVISIPFNAINKVLKKIHGISILGVKPFTWVKTFDVPQIPELETGGVLKKGQVGFLEGNGAEAVVPLEKNKKWIHALAEDMRMEFGNSNNNSLAKKLDEVVSAISSIKIYLDTGAMVGEMTPALDSSLGNLYSAKERGR